MPVSFFDDFDWSDHLWIEPDGSIHIRRALPKPRWKKGDPKPEAAWRPDLSQYAQPLTNISPANYFLLPKDTSDPAWHIRL